MSTPHKAPVTSPLMSLSIRAKMLVAFVGLSLVPMLLLAALLSWQTERLLRERISRELRVEVETAAGALEAYLAGVRRDVLSLSRFLQRRLQPRMTEDQWRAVEEEFLQTLRAEQAYYQIRFITVDGMETIRVNNDRGELSLVPKEGLQYKGDRYYFREALAAQPGEVYLSPLDFNVEQGRIEEPRRLVARLATPVADQSVALRGLVVINVFGEEMLQALERLKTETQMRVFLINADCSFVEKRQESRQDAFQTGTKADLLPLFGPDFSPGAGHSRVLTLTDHLLAEAPVHAGEGQIWHLAKVYPRGEIFADLSRLHRTLLLFALPLVLLAATLAVLAARSFSAPVGRISRFAEALAGGDYDRRIPVTSGDELGQLSASLNVMAGSLAEAHTRLMDWNRSLQAEVARQVEALRLTEADAERSRRAMLELEKQLLLANRLASLGMLSATVAHEIGNPLAGLQTRLQMLRRKTEDTSLQGDLDRMLALVERLGRFLRHLTGYVAPEKGEATSRVDLCQVLRELEFILREEADRRHARLELDLPAQPLWVCSRAQHLHQIFMNLILNALQAAGEGGEVRVAARSDAGRVRVAVTDNGPGLPAGENARLFEPLFTTREGGTGLGLAIVKKLVEELAGTVRLTNRPEGGAVAEVLMPEGSEGCKSGF